MCFSGCLMYFFSLLIFLFQPAIDQNSSIDSAIASEIVDWVIQKTKTLDKDSKFKITSDNEEFTHFLEEDFILKNGRLVEKTDSLTFLFSVTTKGEFSKTNENIHLDGVALIKLINSNQIIETKRLLIKKSVSNTFELESIFWLEKKATKKENVVRKWVEPSLILSAMLLSVYLLFSVRS